MGHQGVLWGLSAQSGHQGCSGVYLSKSAARGCSGAYLSKLATKGAPGTINPTWLRGGTPGPIYPNLPKSAPRMRPWAYTQIGHQASGTYHPNHPQGPPRFHLPNSATRGRIKAGFKRDWLIPIVAPSIAVLACLLQASPDSVGLQQPCNKISCNKPCNKVIGWKKSVK